MQKGGKFASINLTVNPKTVSRLRVAVDFPLKADFTAARIIVSRQKLPQNPRSTSCQAAAAATAAVFSYSFNAFRPIDIWIICAFGHIFSKKIEQTYLCAFLLSFFSFSFLWHNIHFVAVVVIVVVVVIVLLKTIHGYIYKKEKKREKVAGTCLRYVYLSYFIFFFFFFSSCSSPYRKFHGTNISELTTKYCNYEYDPLFSSNVLSLASTLSRN